MATTTLLHKSDWPRFFAEARDHVRGRQVVIEVLDDDFGDQRTGPVPLDNLRYEPDSGGVWIHTPDQMHHVADVERVGLQEEGSLVQAIEIEDPAGACFVLRFQQPVHLPAA